MAPTAETQKTNDLATVLAIATANPEHIMLQSEFPDYYFSVTNCEHAVELKDKVKRICEKSKIGKRYKFPLEDLIEIDPYIYDENYRSFNTRMEYDREHLPLLAAEAASKAIEEWAQPKSSITHLICHSYSAISMPGWDYDIVQLLGLKTNIKRTMLYHNGCYGGGAVLRLSKDIAENNIGSRVLVVCAELMGNAAHKPTSISMGNLVAHSIFADGAAALIVGANPKPHIENPLFELYAAHQDILPDSKYSISGKFGHDGFKASLGPESPSVIGNNIEKSLTKAFKPLDICDWNSLFWVVHPGGAAILQLLEEKLRLNGDKMKATRHVLHEYGNMSSPSVLFVLDEMRKRSLAEGKSTTGDGLKWGILVALGPGITVETIVLRSIPSHTTH